MATQQNGQYRYGLEPNGAACQRALYPRLWLFFWLSAFFFGHALTNHGDNRVYARKDLAGICDRLISLFRSFYFVDAAEKIQSAKPRDLHVAAMGLCWHGNMVAHRNAEQFRTSTLHRVWRSFWFCYRELRAGVLATSIYGEGIFPR